MRAIPILLLLAATVSGQPDERYDLIIRNATIIDGTGAPSHRADVAVVDGFIAAVGTFGNATAAEVIDASGLYLTPGFINLHSHAALDALPFAENMLTQGVTFELLNADGGGGTNVRAQAQEAASRGLALNVGAYIGFNSAWIEVMGEADRRASDADITRMREILTSNLEQGAWGVSAGLDYKPAYYATAEEVVEIVKAAAPWRTNFTNHDRLTPETKYSSRAAIAETIGIGSRAGLVPVVTHMKVQGREQGTASSVLDLLTNAAERGNYAAADAYPYLAGQTGPGALLIPAWAQDGGRNKMLERFSDPALRAKIVGEVEEAMAARFGGAAGVYLPASRRELTDVMKEMKVGAGEAVIRLLEAGNQGAILRFGSEEDLVRILQHPTTSIACDCGASLPGRGSHPRNYGTYPRVLGRYVREQKVLTWEEAIRKMTLLPATTIGVVDRGAVAPGMMADLVVFDPRTVVDHATYDDPTRPSTGVRHVIVNGVMALRDGVATGEKGGQLLRRTRAMASRPMTLASVSRALKAAGTASGREGNWSVTLDLAQRRGQQYATGSVTILNEDKAAARVEGLGVLQVWDGWASITASVKLWSGARRSVTFVVEESDPWRDDRGPSLTMMLRGSGEATEASGRAELVRISGS